MIDQVAELIREVAQTVILPRFRHLDRDEIEEKRPGDVVTVADREAEAALTEGLRKLRPDAAVVGEEAAHADPGLIKALETGGPAWIIDPVDGTANFAAGKPIFAVMVAFAEQGLPRIAWIHDPVANTMTVAAAGAGAWDDGQRLNIPPAPPIEEMHGGVLTRFLPGELRGPAEAACRRFASTGGFFCAGREYLALARGEKHFSLYYRTLPWDHAPGSLIVAEAGATVARFDGSPYRLDENGTGLFAATDPANWRMVRDLLLPRFSGLEA